MKKVDLNEQSISAEVYSELGKNYFCNPSNVLVRHALSKTDIPTIVSDSKNSVETLNNFSNEIKTLPVANQKGSGRCWIFAGLNVLREIIAKECKLDNFELSQNYVAFFDKLEKANYFLTSIIDLIDSKPDDRTFMYLLDNAVGDGGQWICLEI